MLTVLEGKGQGIKPGKIRVMRELCGVDDRLHIYPLALYGIDTG